MSSVRLARAHSWLAEREPSEEVLIVGANRHAADDLVRRIAATVGGVFGWHRLTLPQLAAAIAAPELASRGLVPLSRLGTEALAASAVNVGSSNGSLGIYEPIGKTPGFPRAVASVLSELRLAGIPSSALDTARPDLGLILRAYECELDAAKLIDWPGILSMASDAIETKSVGARQLAGLPILLLDVPIESAASARLIAALLAATSSFFAILPADDTTSIEHLRHMPELTFESLDSTTDGQAPVNNALRRLQHNLFSPASPPGEVAGDATVEMFSAPGEGRECVEIARRVLRLAKQGTPFDRMAVLLRAPKQYRAHLEEAFARAGIPVHLARGAVRPDPSGRAFCALLRCAVDGLSARRFAEYLSLGQVPNATSDGRPPDVTPSDHRWIAQNHELLPPALGATEPEQPYGEDSERCECDRDAPVKDGQLRAPRRWEQLLVEAAVIGGRDRWRRRLTGLKQAFQIQLSELEGDDDARSTATQKALDDLEAFTCFAMPLIVSLDDLPNAESWEVWLRLLGDLATRAIRKPDRILAVFAELAPMGPIGPVPLDEVVSTLESLLLEVAEPSSGPVYGRVFIAPVDAARGLHFDAVFIPGLAEKLFPQRIVEEPLLLDSVREQLPGQLLTNQARLDRERLALTIAVGSADRAIAFSYPRLDLNQGRPRVPSFYALETIRAAEGQLLDFAELARRSGLATSARLGWPAPLMPADAIDTTEHDLAVLAAISDKTSAGTARYLLDANPYLARALRSRFQRWGHTWTSADGLVKGSAVTDAIMARNTFAARSYSPTALQNYAACPYRFFLQAIHRLAPREAPAEIERLDPLQRGSFIHDCQFQLYMRLRDQKLLPILATGLAAAYRTLEEIIAVNAKRYRDDLAPAIERVWEDEIAAIHADLREWLRLASEDETGYVPWQFELAFGLGRQRDHRQVDPASVAVSVDLDCGIQLRGSIDLVERHPSGHLRVTDHKTGKASARRGQIVTGGGSLQPLFYALAAERIYGETVEITGGRLYFCTSRGAFAEHVVALDDQSRGIATEVAAPSYIDLHGAPLHPRDLRDHLCIGFRWPGHAALYNWDFCENGVWFSVPVTGPLTFNDQRAALDAADAGAGIAFWVESEVQPFVTDGRLVQLLSDYSGAFPGFALYYAPHRHRSAAVTTFIAALRGVGKPKAIVPL